MTAAPSPLASEPAAWRAPRWLPGGNAQTIWPALCSRRPPAVAWRRERWDTPDGDFVDVDFIDAADDQAPMAVLLHGLEGSSRSHYALAFAHWAECAGWRFALPHWRGCSGELNRAPRAYHSGDFEEVAWLLQRLRALAVAPLHVAGVSLGGNALLRWAAEAGDSAHTLVQALASISAPLDLAAGGHAIDRGLNRLLYARMFLNTMKAKALAKLVQHPGLFDRERLLAARTLYEFDNVFTAPLHGFRDTDDYWARASAKPHLARIRVPTLALNARNDPFVPAASLAQARAVGSHVTLWQPAHGGHVGFPGGAFPGHLMTLPDAVMGWFRHNA
ncbi:MAG TPA: alpha/beta fold hydrolase [Burkholderiaceae bacterium]|nr:alpha/beta fold hydrolase [Burkholderiaceae bacterium]